ncbi:MAG: flagellar biosynthetic protein FliO [Desulfobacteraceae bacterium]|nr:flagellar biosynthetic protein FliO [Desulfobacteraceae bacterium]
MATIKMVLSLALVLALLWGLHRYVRRVLPAGRFGGRERLIKVLCNHSLGMKKSVALVQVPGKVLVLGIGTDQVNLLTLIDDPSLLSSLTTEAPRPDSTSFTDQLQRLTNQFGHAFKKTNASGDQRGMA